MTILIYENGHFRCILPNSSSLISNSNLAKWGVLFPLTDGERDAKRKREGPKVRGGAKKRWVPTPSQGPGASLTTVQPGVTWVSAGS